MLQIIYLSLLLVLLFSGCSETTLEPEIDFKPPVYVEQMPPREEEEQFSSAGSIFGTGDNPLFADHKAMHVNDIVTITISESSSSSSKANKALSESDVSTLAGLNINTTDPFISNTTKNVLNTSFGTNSNSAFKGQGSYSKNASFTTTISARIIKVLANGNYFVSGRREILIDGQKQIIQVSGVIRPYDIGQDNRISSAKMSDAKISYKSEGDIDRSVKRGWASSFVHALWPF